MPQSSPSNGSAWWNHETDRSQMAQLSSQYAQLERDKHKSGWQRNGTIFACVLCAVSLLAALRMLLLG